LGSRPSCVKKCETVCFGKGKLRAKVGREGVVRVVGFSLVRKSKDDERIKFLVGFAWEKNEYLVF
jgi:hypothetical protein